MRTVNANRAKLLTNVMKKAETEQEIEDELWQEEVDCQFTVNALASKLLAGIASLKENGRCECSYGFENHEFSMISVSQSLKADFSNLAASIIENLGYQSCPECSTELTIEREFGTFIFIQVILHILFINLTNLTKLLNCNYIYCSNRRQMSNCLF